MSFSGLVSSVLVPVCWVLVSAEERPSSTAGPRMSATNSSRLNGTRGGGPDGSMVDGSMVDGSMVQRALYVLIAITAIGLLYFLIRAVRLKRPANKKKYGLLSNYDDSVEMEAVESEEDDTLYEARSLRR
ncbi:protein FAM174C [Anoplopoma fimbria]|uniref:protein FAM174C n=1 Tax=Anoplopoma fimbria TaxID=229290 RepID=UPI0023ECA451|nr:protein FAM174C [Anoplopoma fimbria]